MSSHMISIQKVPPVLRKIKWASSKDLDRLVALWKGIIFYLQSKRAKVPASQQDQSWGWSQRCKWGRWHLMSQPFAHPTWASIIHSLVHCIRQTQEICKAGDSAPIPQPYPNFPGLTVINPLVAASTPPNPASRETQGEYGNWSPVGLEHFQMLLRWSDRCLEMVRPHHGGPTQTAWFFGWFMFGWFVNWTELCLLSLLFSHSVVSNSLQPYEQQHARVPCPSLPSGVCSNSCPLSQWRHLTISSSVDPFSSCHQSFPASGSFPVSWLFNSGSQSVGASTSASVFPVNIQGWFSLGLTDLISLQSKGLSRVFFNATVQKHQFFGIQPSLWSNFHIHMWLLEKTIALTIQTFVGEVMSLLFNMLSKFVIVFLPRSKCLSISWL